MNNVKEKIITVTVLDKTYLNLTNTGLGNNNVNRG